MATAKYEDLQNVTVTVPQGTLHGHATVTHHLQDENGNHLTPDDITPEVISFETHGATRFQPQDQIIERSDPEDGTFRITQLVFSTGNETAPNHILLRVRSVYRHSVQGADHVQDPWTP